MVFGNDLIENIERLGPLVDDIEIVLFYTPTLDNFPSPAQLADARRIGAKNNCTFSVHLPAALEPAAPEPDLRRHSVQMALDLCRRLAVLEPQNYTIHLPLTRPTLVPDPSAYIHDADAVGLDMTNWYDNAQQFLMRLNAVVCCPERILVENINYAPNLLAPLWDQGLCGFCIDFGHLVLGQQDPVAILEQYYDFIGCVHMHGVAGGEEHVSLARMPDLVVESWCQALFDRHFEGIVTLEVFTETDLTESIAMIESCWQKREVL